MNLSEIENNKFFYAVDNKFKNFKVVLSFKTPLDKESATLNSLLVKVLLDGCEKYKTKREISMKLKKLYGSSLSAKCIKNGFAFCPTFEMDVISEKFSDSAILGDVMEVFEQILLHPLIENGAFKSEYVEREKKVLINDIESVANDKRKYAAKRCLEISCGDNPYGVFELGDSKVCETVTPVQLYDHYKKIITSCAYSVLVLGNFDEKQMESAVSALCGKLGRGEKFCGEALPVNGEETVTREEGDITQGKLSLGFKTGVIEKDKQYIWQVLNGLFGGGVSSKLFNNVREKMSLCYYASSTLNQNIGFIQANAGIDFENFEKTLSAIKEQLSDIAADSFTDTEFENVKTGIINNLQMASDDIDLLLNYYLYQIEKEDMLTPLEKAEKISGVSRELIPALARQIKLETVYFLCGREEA